VLQDFVLLAETLSISFMSMQIIKNAFDRPRPYMYQDTLVDDRRKHSSYDISSFYSGHTAIAFATATSLSYIFSVRHRKNKLKYLLWSASLCAAASVGLLRVFSGRHFWTDVTSGAIIGASTGLIVPALHRTVKDSTVSVFSGPGNITLRVIF